MTAKSNVPVRFNGGRPGDMEQSIETTAQVQRVHLFLLYLLIFIMSVLFRFLVFMTTVFAVFVLKVLS